jgi:hypothetical protein
MSSSSSSQGLTIKRAVVICMGNSWLGERDERYEKAILPARRHLCCLRLLERRKKTDFHY